MTFERQAMKDLMDSFHTEKMPTGISSTGKEETERRLCVLKNAYEIRIRSTLEQDFQRTKASLPLQDWLRLGKDFSHREALKLWHLGLLTPTFAAYLDLQNLSEQAQFSRTQDFLQWQCRHSPFSEALSPSHLEKVDEHTVLRSQATVRLTCKKNLNFWVISRNRQSFFEAEVGAPVAQTLNELQKSSQKVHDIMENFASHEELSQFFVLAVTNAWLKSPQ